LGDGKGDKKTRKRLMERNSKWGHAGVGRDHTRSVAFRNNPITKTEDTKREEKKKRKYHLKVFPVKKGSLEEGGECTKVRGKH